MSTFFSKFKLLFKKTIILFGCILLCSFSWNYKKFFNIDNNVDAITADIELPDNFYYNDYIPSIFINFSNPIVKLDMVDKEFKEGIKISPDIKGEFIFLSPTYLKFEPKENWKANTEYKISFSKNIEKFKELKKNTISFSTTPNFPYISKYEFYENPLNIKERTVSGTLTFPYPTEIKDIEKNITLESSFGKMPFVLKSNKDKTEIYINSEPVEIKDKEDYVSISYRVKKKEVKDRIRIPSTKDYFKINSISTSIVFNSDKQEEEQIVILSFSRPVKVSDVLNGLTIKKYEGELGCYQKNIKNLAANAIDLKYDNMTGATDYSKIITLKVDIPNYKQACILTSMKNQLISEDGFVLNDSDIRVNRAPSFTKDVRVVFDGSIINSNSDKTLSFSSRGYDALMVEINRLNDNSINHLITQTSGDFKSAYFDHSYYFNESNIAQKFTEIISLNNTSPSKNNYSSIDLFKYMNNKKGIFIVNVRGYDPIKKYAIGSGDRRMIIVTDMGIIVKNNYNKSKDVFVSSLTSGTPLVNAKVEVMGKNGVAVASKNTDVDGHVSFPSLENYKNEKQPVAYVVYSDGEISFIPFSRYDRELNYSRYDVGGVYLYNYSNSSNIKSYIFTDRDLYRPGETVYIGFITKNNDLGYLPSNMPLEIVITDVSGKEIYNQKIKNGDGFFDLNFETKSTMQTGEYYVYLYSINKKGHRDSFLTSKSIKLEEFQPDRMKINIIFDNVNKDGWYNSSSLLGEIKLENLFGAPAQNRKVTSKITIKPINFVFQKYKDYKFRSLWNEDLYKTQTIIEDRPVATTDDNGVVKFDIDLSKYINGTYNLSLFVEGFEPDGGRSVVSMKNVLISPLKYTVGYKTNSDLGYIKKDTEHSAEFIAIDSSLNRINVDNLKVRIQKVSYESILIQEESGNLRYQKEKVYKEISVNDINISKDGTIYKLPTDTVGEIQLLVIDSNNNVLSAINYNVVGMANNTLSIDKNAELKLILDKNEYNSGDIIEMAITSPYTGYGLITIERDKVYAYKWFKMDTTNSVQTIRLPNNIDGNAYINVSLMRDINSKEIFINPLSYAVAPFSINKSKFKINIDLDSPTKVKPGDVLKVNYKLDKKANIVLYGVDEGILQVARYTLPNPLAEFTKKMALQVVTSQIVDLVLPSFSAIKEVAGIGGGEDFESVVGNLNPFARKVNKPVAFWSGILKDKISGSYEYVVPDYFNGKLRIMAVAVGNDSLGSAQTYTNSQADIVLLPNMPVNISPNEEVEVSVGVGNYIENSGKNAEISIVATTSNNLQIIGEIVKKITVAENHEGSVKFSVKALNNLGNGEVKFVAQCLNCKTDDENKMVSTISVRPSSPYQVSIDSGKDKSKTFTDLKNLYNEYRDVKLFVSPSPIVLTQGLFDYLSEFPFGCSEQITSKAFPVMVINDRYPELITTEKPTLLIKNSIAELIQRQNNDGGFAAWSNMGYPRTDTFHTLYIMHFLTVARKNNYYVPNDAFNNGIRWIKNFTAQNPTNENDLRNKAYGIYILTLNDILSTANLTSLEKIAESDYPNSLNNDVTGLYMAASYKLMLQDKKAEELVNKFKFQDKISYFNSYDTSDFRNVQYIYLTSLYFPDIFRKNREKSLDVLLNMIQDKRYNTLLSSYAIMTLGNFSDTLKSNSVVFSMKDREGKLIDPITADSPFTLLGVPNNAIEAGFKNDTALYYSFIQSGFSRNSVQKAFSKNMEITKKITNLEGKEINSANQGDEVLVVLKLQNLKDTYIENAAIVDLFPTGFELKEVMPNDDLYSTNVREDRFIGYLGLGNRMVEITYRAKLTAKGKFIVPAAFVEDLYNNRNQAQSNSSEFEVK